MEWICSLDQILSFLALLIRNTNNILKELLPLQLYLFSLWKWKLMYMRIKHIKADIWHLQLCPAYTAYAKYSSYVNQINIFQIFKQIWLVNWHFLLNISPAMEVPGLIPLVLGLKWLWLLFCSGFYSSFKNFSPTLSLSIIVVGKPQVKGAIHLIPRTRFYLSLSF